VAAYYMVPVYGIVSIGFVWAGIQTVCAVYGIVRLREFMSGRMARNE
jgi:hypothetical protein